jgi:hypothetical protein
MLEKNAAFNYEIWLSGRADTPDPTQEERRMSDDATLIKRSFAKF